MTAEGHDIPAPVAPAPATAAQVAGGPVIPPQQQLLLYSEDQWEDFVHEWAHYFLKHQYTEVKRFTGAGDRGIDIAGLTDAQKLQGMWDNYQCKHYDHALRPSDAWVEIGKIIWHSFKKDYRAPRRYFFVAPKGAGTGLSALLADSGKLRAGLIANWNKYVRTEITSKQEVVLEGDLLAYVNGLDFSFFDAKSSLQLVEEHRQTPCFAARFGGGLPARPAAPQPPSAVAGHESRYIGKLLDAYANHTKTAITDPGALKAVPKLNAHFGRQREAFYQAEALRVFARDSVPAGTFEALQGDIYGGVIDTHDADHADGYARVCEVTKAARGMQITSNALISCTNPKDRDGICHQLANEDRLQWIKP
ncbi:MAG: ABC-three component system protein [Burkholderiaceae bacterium]